MEKEEVIKLIDEKLQETVLQEMLRSKSVKQRHVEANIIFFGTAANRPDGTTEVKAWFATDTNTLSLWNGSAWVEEVLT